MQKLSARALYLDPVRPSRPDVRSSPSASPVGEPATAARRCGRSCGSARHGQNQDVSPPLRERLAADLPTGVEVLDERTADRGSTGKAVTAPRAART
jgi:hypothetical protein